MTLLNSNVVIVERVDAGVFQLCIAFNKAGAQTHIVASLPSALQVVKSQKIDAVLIKFSRDPDTIAFCKSLSELSIPYVFTSEPMARYAVASRDVPDIVKEIKHLIVDQVTVH
jgi:hypothetical protein